MSALLKLEQTAFWVECANCGITFGMLTSWNQRLVDSHKTFYCPNVNANTYAGKSEAEKLRRELEKERRLRERAEHEATGQRNLAKNANTSATKAKNKLKRITTRVNAGVCPHCNRTFKQLAAHMKCKHAPLAEQEEADATV